MEQQQNTQDPEPAAVLSTIRTNDAASYKHTHPCMLSVACAVKYCCCSCPAAELTGKLEIGLAKGLGSTDMPLGVRPALMVPFARL